MKGLLLAKKYYCEVGRPAIEKELPEVLPFLAAGLSGDGSDCLGYDDAFSADHDFGPGFCVWLDDGAYELYGQKMQALYERLPASFDGVPARISDPRSGKRVGVFRISDFCRAYLGSELPPETDSQWDLLNDARLRAFISGEVFEDHPGIFTAIREIIEGYYPERVRLKRMADTLHLVSQTGQYNYARCMQRGDTVAAALCLSEFVRQVISLAHLLDRVYEPYYKWAWKSFTELKSSEGLVLPLSRLLETPVNPAVWQGSWGPGINVKDEKVLLIESVCARILSLLTAQQLTDRKDSFLDLHAGEIAARAAM